MAKGPGSTRSGSSSNPRGNSGARVNASRPSQLEIEDRIIALEGERQRAIYAGDFDRRDEINAEIKALREQYRQAGEPLPVTGVFRSFPNASLTDVRDNVALVNFMGRWAANPFDLKDGTFAMQFSERMPDTSRKGLSDLEKRLGIEVVATDKVDNFIRFRYKERSAPVKMPTMPKKDTGSRATVRFGEDTYEISHYSTGYGNDKRTNGTFNVAINGRGLTRFDYGPGPYRAYKNAREAYEAIKKMLRKRDSNS